jgi:hypothetical protein
MPGDEESRSWHIRSWANFYTRVDFVFLGASRITHIRDSLQAEGVLSCNNKPKLTEVWLYYYLATQMAPGLDTNCYEININGINRRVLSCKDMMRWCDGCFE